MKKCIVIGWGLLVAATSAPALAQVAMPEELRGILPEYPNQRVMIAFSPGEAEHVQIDIPDKFETVSAFFKKHLLATGWKVEIEMTLEDNYVLSLTKEGRRLGLISYQSNESTTSISFTLEKE